MEKITLRQTFESGKTYVADRKQYDVYLDDTYYHPSNKLTGDNSAFALIGLHDVTLDFGGAVILLHGKLQPFLIERCSNITVKNVTVKFDRPPFTEFEILDRGKDFLRVRANPAHPCRVENGQLIPYSETWENTKVNHAIHFILCYDAKTLEGTGFTLGVIGKDPVIDTSLPWADGCQKWIPEADGDDIIFRGKDIPEFYGVGNVLVYGHEPRDLSSLAAHYCENLTVENFRIIDGFSMGIFITHTKNVYLDGFKLFRDELSTGITTNGADALHTFACSGEFIIKNSIFEGMIDDALNIHSTFYQVAGGSGKELIAYCSSNDASDIAVYDVGDRIAVLKGKTLERAAEYTIEKCEIIDNKNVRLTLDRELEKHEIGDCINNLSTVCDLHISDCRFGKAAVAHLRFQNGGKTLVERCTSGCSFCLTGDMSYWFESDPLKYFKVRDCALTGHAIIEATSEYFPTEKEPYYHKVIDVADTTIERELAVDAKGVGKVLFKNVTNPLGREMTVKLTNCGDAEVEGAKVERITKEVNDLAFN